MEKFKVGDKVKVLRCSGKDFWYNKSIGQVFTIASIIRNDVETLEKSGHYIEFSDIEIYNPEQEFAWGEDVEVSDGESGKHYIDKFVGLNPFGEGFITIDEDGIVNIWKHCRKIKTKISKKEIADKFGIDINNLEIIE